MTEKKTTKWLRRIPVAGEKIANRVEGGPLVNVLRLDGVIGRASGPRRGGIRHYKSTLAPSKDDAMEEE